MEQRTASDGRWEIYEPQKRQFEPIVEIPPANRVIINTSLPVEKTVRQVLDKLPGSRAILSNQEV